MSTSLSQSNESSNGRFEMAADTIVGDAGNLTVYERPDGSRYALDRKGHGAEWEAGDPIFGRARFDSRPSSTGSWPGSRSAPASPEPEPGRARLHGRPKVR